MVRQISHRHHGGKKWKILYRDRDYHGTTISGAVLGGPAATRDAIRAVYSDGFVEVPHCLEYRKQWDVEDYGRARRRCD
ncbi:MAG: hypothetical protein V9G14_12910 [Cypionkella sp.]